MSMYYFSCGSDAITLTKSPEGKLIGLYRSVKDYHDNPPDLEKGLDVMCSSSLDWPEDVTSDINVIELADRIRGNNVSGRNPLFVTHFNPLKKK